MKKQMRLKIIGKVQGVFFRAEAAKKALELGVTGWVRNTAEGHVEAVVQGEENSLLKFYEWCEKGPERALVKLVSVKVEDAAEEFKDFLIC